MTDAFTDILRMMRLSSSVYFHEHFAAPWGMAVDEGRFGQFHMIAGGECFLQSPALSQPRALSEGDVVLFPTGAAHSLTDALDSPQTNGKAVVDAIAANKNPFRGTAVATDIVCGHFEFDESVRSTFVSLLPPVIVIRKSEAISWMGTVVRIILDETLRMTDGGKIVAERLAEGLFIEILRQHSTQESLPGLVTGLADQPIKAALDAMHSYPARRWTLVELAKEAGASRTTFAVRFRKNLGVTPMDYLNGLRMTRALQALQDVDKSLTDIAEQIGYSSEASFIRAFKRRFGETPGRRRKRLARSPA